MSRFEAVELIDENGDSYGVPNVNGKPRVSSQSYLYDIAEKNIPDHYPLNKFGQNSNVGTSQVIVSDLGQTIYPYLDVAEQLQVFSSDVDDQGLLVDSGIATGGSSVTLVDSGADFIVDGVAVGDLLINDTKEAHGVITIVTATTITVNSMHDSGVEVVNDSGDVYRIANANDTGAAVVSIIGLDANYNECMDHVILNGTTNVTTLLSFIRVFRVRVHLAGISGFNEGDITIEDNASAVELAQVKAERGQTLMAQWTVPEGKTCYIVQWTISDETNKGAEIIFKTRPFGEAWQIKDIKYSIGSSVVKPYLLPLMFNPRTDIEIRATSISSSGAITSSFAGWYEDI